MLTPQTKSGRQKFAAKNLNGVYITYSSDILPKMGEYERESTCVISASVGPIVARTRGLEDKLRAAGFCGAIADSPGQPVCPVSCSDSRKPVYLTGSGPAAGPAGAVQLGNLIGEPNFLTGDMGGTTWDAAVVKTVRSALKKWWLACRTIGWVLRWPMLSVSEPEEAASAG